MHFTGNRSTSNSIWGFNRSPVQQQSFSNSPNPNYSWSRIQNNMQNSFGNNTSPNQSNNNSFNSPYKTYTKDEIITDEHGLQKYLRYLVLHIVRSNFKRFFLIQILFIPEKWLKKRQTPLAMWTSRIFEKRSIGIQQIHFGTIGIMPPTCWKHRSISCRQRRHRQASNRLERS